MERLHVSLDAILASHRVGIAGAEVAEPAAERDVYVEGDVVVRGTIGRFYCSEEVLRLYAVEEIGGRIAGVAGDRLIVLLEEGIAIFHS